MIYQRTEDRKQKTVASMTVGRKTVIPVHRPPSHWLLSSVICRLSSESNHKLFWIIIFSLVTFHLWLLTNLRFEAWPEMLLIPYLQLKGFRLYSDMVYHYNPGLAWLGKAWFGIFGSSPDALKSLTWGIILLNDLLAGLIAWKRWGKSAAVGATATLTLIQPLFDGNGLWYELAMTPWLLLAFWSQNPTFIAISFLFKQSTFWFFPAMYRKWKMLLLLLIGTFVSLSTWFWLQGSLEEFWFWPYQFIFTIFPRLAGYPDWASWRHWVLPVGLTMMVLSWRVVREKSAKFLVNPKEPLVWAILGFPLMFPRFGLFHFQATAAFLALELGRSIGEIKQRSLFQALFLGGIVLLAGIFWQRKITLEWRQLDRFLEPSIYQTAARIAQDTTTAEPVFLLNGPEQVYVLANRVPPRQWLTQFSWFLELPGFQQRLIESYRSQGLRQVFITPYQSEGEFVPGSYQPRLLVEYINTLGPKELVLP